MKKRSFAITVFILMLFTLFLFTVWTAGSLLVAPQQSVVGSLPVDLRGEAVEFNSDSGARLRGWFIKGETGAGAIILMHGLGAARRQMLGRARFLNRVGYGVLLFDFGAHGESTGQQQVTFGFLESRDAVAALAWLRARVPNESIGVIGISMGGAATLLAQPPLEVDAMVIEETYPTIEEAVANRLAVNLGAWARADTALNFATQTAFGNYTQRLKTD